MLEERGYWAHLIRTSYDWSTDIKPHVSDYMPIYDNLNKLEILLQLFARALTRCAMVHV